MEWILISLLAAPWVILATLSAFGDALVGFIDERLLHTISTSNPESNAPGTLVIFSGLFGFVTAGVFGVLSLLIPSIVLSTDQGLYMAMIAGVIEVIWLIPYFYAIHTSDALDATPLLQTVPIFAGILGYFVFSDIPTTIQLAGVGALLCGALLLNCSPAFKKIKAVTIVLMLLSSAIIAIGLFVFKDAALTATIPTAIVGNGIGMGCTAIVIWLLYKPFRIQFNRFITRRDVKAYILQTTNECVYTFSALCGQYAIVLGPSVVVVSAFNALHPLFTLLIALMLGYGGDAHYRSKLTKQSIPLKCAGVICISIGALLVT